MAGDRAFLRRWQTPLLFLAAFVLVVALASNLANLSEPSAAAPRARDRSTVIGLIPTWLFAVLVWASALVLLAVFVGLYLWVRRARTRRPAMPWHLLAVVLALTIVIPFLLAWFVPGTFTRPGAAETTNATTDATSPLGAGTELFNAPLQVARSVPVVAMAFVLVVLAFALATLPRWMPSRGRLPPGLVLPVTQEVANTVQKAIQDLEAGKDPREAILACYAALMALLGRHGLSDLEPLTPREVERRALVKLGLSERDIDSITTIFEEARYSDHPMGPESRDRAREALRALQASLEA